METVFNYQDVPVAYVHCMNAGCERSSDCLRHQAWLRVDRNQPSVRIVNPLYLSGREECPSFHLARTLRYAWGITHLYDKLAWEDYKAIKNELLTYFGRTAYYRIRRKERPVSPKEQAHVQHIFEQKEIDRKPVFDQYTDTYDWGF